MWNRKPFNVYDNEAKTVLELIKDLGKFANNMFFDLKNKTDLHGDHKGSWCGISKPQYAEPGIASVVDKLDNAYVKMQNDITNITTIVTPDGVEQGEQINKLLREGVKNLKLVGNFKINIPIIVPSNSTITQDDNGEIVSNCENLFILNESTNNVLFKNLNCKNVYTENYSCFKFNGGDNLEQSEYAVNNITIENSKFIGYNMFADMKRVRKSNIIACEFHGKNGILYHHKSAEVNILNSFFIHYNFPIENTYGIKCIADGEHYPEGITVTNTLFYEFERNINIQDLYVGNFTSCHIDGKHPSSKENLINYNRKTEMINFNACWFFARGIVFNQEGKNLPCRFKSNISSCKFDTLKGNGIFLNRFAHDINVSSCTFYGDGTGTEKYCLAGVTNNNNISFTNNSSFFMNRIFVLNGVGENNTLYSNVCDITEGEKCYSNYPVANDEIFLYHITEVERKRNNAADEVVTSTVKLSKGTYQLTLTLNESVVHDGGYLKISNTNKTSVKGATFKRIDTNDKNISFTSFINVPTSTTEEIKIVVESGAITTGYNSNLTLTKI